MGDIAMHNRLVNFVTALACSILCSVAWGQTSSTPSSGTPAPDQQSTSGTNMPGMSGPDMSGMHMKDMPMSSEKDGDNDKDKDKDAEGDASAHVMNSMEGHMDMGPHMKMTALRQPKPGDRARAHQVADEARRFSTAGKREAPGAVTSAWPATASAAASSMLAVTFEAPATVVPRPRPG